jgi:hypothetical protein
MAEETRSKSTASIDPEVWSIVTEELSALPEQQCEVLHGVLLDGQY